MTFRLRTWKICIYAVCDGYFIVTLDLLVLFFIKTARSLQCILQFYPPRFLPNHVLINDRNFCFVSKCASVPRKMQRRGKNYDIIQDYYYHHHVHLFISLTEKNWGVWGESWRLSYIRVLVVFSSSLFVSYVIAFSTHQPYIDSREEIKIIKAILDILFIMNRNIQQRKTVKTTCTQAVVSRAFSYFWCCIAARWCWWWWWGMVMWSPCSCHDHRPTKPTIIIETSLLAVLGRVQSLSQQPASISFYLLFLPPASLSLFLFCAGERTLMAP